MERRIDYNEISDNIDYINDNKSSEDSEIMRSMEIIELDEELLKINPATGFIE